MVRHRVGGSDSVMIVFLKGIPSASLSRKAHLVIFCDLFQSLLTHHCPDDTHVKLSYGNMPCVYDFVCVCVFVCALGVVGLQRLRGANFMAFYLRWSQERGSL